MALSEIARTDENSQAAKKPDAILIPQPSSSGLGGNLFINSTAMTYSSFRALRTFSGFDGIRAICALAVVIEHCQGAAGKRFLRFGFLGVDMFFVISGFLIVTLLLRERDNYGTINLRKFYARRALRIFPIYYLLIGSVLFFYLIISPWRPNGLAFYLPGSWVLALYLQDLKVAQLGIFSHTWSLAMEEQFYIVWPAMEKFTAGLGQGLFLGILMAFCQACNFGLTDHLIDHVYGSSAAHLRPFFLCTFAPIVFGVLLAHLMHAQKTFAIFANAYKTPIIIPCLLMVMLIAAELSGGNIQGLPRLVIHVSMTLLLAAIVLDPDNLIARILQIKPIAFVGRISYGVYLYHTTILALVVGAMKVYIKRPSTIELVLVVVPITLLVAAASYRWIETPCLKLRETRDLMSRG